MATMPPFSAFPVLYAVIAAVHLHLHYRLWIRRDEDAFSKYSAGKLPPAVAASRAYCAKAVWLVLLVMLQAVGREFREALAVSFLAYALLLLGFFGPRRYVLLHLPLALACLAETVLVLRD